MSADVQWHQFPRSGWLLFAYPQIKIKKTRYIPGLFYCGFKDRAKDGLSLSIDGLEGPIKHFDICLWNILTCSLMDVGLSGLSLWSRNGFRGTHTGAWLTCIDNNLSLRRNLPKVTWRVHCKMWPILPSTKQAGTTKPHVFTVFDGPLGLLCFLDKQPTTLYCSASWKKRLLF